MELKGCGHGFISHFIFYFGVESVFHFSVNCSSTSVIFASTPT